MNDISKIMTFFSEIEKLKQTYRYWIKNDWNFESCAEHAWKLAFMTFSISKYLDYDIDVIRAMKIALIHDLWEALCWNVDAAISEKNEKIEQKRKTKQEKIMNNFRLVLWNWLWEEIYELWNEYEESESKEAKLVAVLDKIETINHFIESEYTKDILDLPWFLVTYADNVWDKFPSLIPVIKNTKLRLKEKFRQRKIEWEDTYNKWLD